VYFFLPVPWNVAPFSCSEGLLKGAPIPKRVFIQNGERIRVERFKDIEAWQLTLEIKVYGLPKEANEDL